MRFHTFYLLYFLLLNFKVALFYKYMDPPVFSIIRKSSLHVHFICLIPFHRAEDETTTDTEASGTEVEQESLVAPLASPESNELDDREPDAANLNTSTAGRVSLLTAPIAGSIEIDKATDQSTVATVLEYSTVETYIEEPKPGTLNVALILKCFVLYLLLL